MDGWTGQSCRKRNIERQIRILVNWVIVQDGETIIFAITGTLAFHDLRTYNNNMDLVH